MADYVNVMNRAVSLETAPEFAPIMAVCLWYTDDVCYFAGAVNDTVYTTEEEFVAAGGTGRILEADCPWATEAIARGVLASVKGFAYQPFSAAAALLDPVAEIGDGVSIGDTYSVLASIDTTFDAMCVSAIGAPSDEEIDHEYPYLSPVERKFNRQVATTRSLITKTATEITQTVEKVSGKADDALKEASAISLRLDSLTLSVENGEKSSTIQLKADGVLIGTSQLIEFDGDVVFASDLTDGTTQISGDNITTGTIKSNRIKLGGEMNIYESLSDDADLAGQIGFGKVTVDGVKNDSLGLWSGSSVHLQAADNGYFLAEGEIITSANDSITYQSWDRHDFYLGNTLCYRIMDEWHLFYGDGMAFNNLAFATRSDRRLKTDIDYDVADRLITAFDALKPVSFKMLKDITPGQQHIGFIAQDVIEAISAAGLGDALTALDSRGYYGLNYDEITALLTAKVQQLDAEVKELKAKWTN